MFTSEARWKRCSAFWYRICQAGAEEGDIRLANSIIAPDGSAEFGRLEVFHNGGWGTVCDTTLIDRPLRQVGFNAGAADVACRQLGYQQGFQIQKLVCPACRTLRALELLELHLSCFSTLNNFGPG